MQTERKAMYELGTRRSIPVTLEIKKGNRFIEAYAPNLEHTINFDSLTACIEYLSKLGLTIKIDTLTKYIKKEKIFHNFLCKYSDSTLPIDFEEVGLIIDEYKKLKVDSGTLNLNKKNKPIFVKGENFIRAPPSRTGRAPGGAEPKKNLIVLWIQLDIFML